MALPTTTSLYRSVNREHLASCRVLGRDGMAVQGPGGVCVERVWVACSGFVRRDGTGRLQPAPALQMYRPYC